MIGGRCHLQPRGGLGRVDRHDHLRRNLGESDSHSIATMDRTYVTPPPAVSKAFGTERSPSGLGPSRMPTSEPETGSSRPWTSHRRSCRAGDRNRSRKCCTESIWRPGWENRCRPAAARKASCRKEMSIVPRHSPVIEVGDLPYGPPAAWHGWSLQDVGMGWKAEGNGDVQMKVRGGPEQIPCRLRLVDRGQT